MFKVVFRNQAIKSMKQIPNQWRRRIFRVIEGLKMNPYQGKKLKGKLSNLYSIRVWPYRIIYLINQQTITIVIFNIGYRKDICKN